MSSSNADPAGVALRLDMAELLADRLTALGDGISEYCYSNLYLFRQTHEYTLLEGDYPCVAGRTYDGKRYLMPLFDLTEVPHNDLLKVIGDYDFFFPVSEQTLGGLDTSQYEISHSRNDSDYLYAAENFIHYSGEKLSKKKNLMRQYLRGGKTETRRFSREHFDDARQVLDHWQQDKQKASSDTDYHPCLEALLNFETLGLSGFMHYRDQRPTGFLLGKEVWPGIFAIHFAKGTIQDNGIFQYMFHHLAREMEGVYSFYNFEQDLGITNFRKTKQSYVPYKLLRKYRLKPIS